jgi:16S rRNA U516 pseudouridylate synthase RsuA-like enzyme
MIVIVFFNPFGVLTVFGMRRIAVGNIMIKRLRPGMGQELSPQEIRGLKGSERRV